MLGLLPVFLADMKHLPNDVFTEFIKGNFTVKRSVHQFSPMGTDQAHEQINKSGKVNLGAIGILDNDNTLLESSTASPVIAEILENFNDRCQRVMQTPIKHHEDTKNFQETFVRDFDKFCNPFDEPGEELLNIFTRQVFSEESAISVRSAEEIGN